MPPDPFRWSCRSFVSIWRAFMLIHMIYYKNELKVTHRKQVNAPSNMKLAISLIKFECQPCGIFECFLYQQ